MKKPMVNRMKWISILMLAAFTSACGSNSTAPSAGEKTDAVKKQDPTKVSIVVNNGTRKYPDGMDANNNPYIKYLKEKTNLDINVISPPADGYQDKMSVMMASGDLPDMLYTSDVNWVVNFISQKAFQPLNDVLDKYGPDLKKLIPKEAWDTVTFDGKIYGVPLINQIQGNELMYIRKDWLDKVGMKEPKTLDEYVAVMKAFRDQDPDSNGKNDTFGFSAMENLARTSPIMGAFGIQRSQWIERNGQIVNSSVQPEMKEALKFLADLHKEKLIDPEWALNKQKNFEEKVASGKVGLFSAAYFDTRGPIETNRKNDSKANWVPLEFPVGKSGKSGTAAVNLVKAYNLIPASSKNAAEIVKMLNFIVGEGQKTLALGNENEIWSNKDGKFTMNFEEHNKHIYRITLSELVQPADMSYTNMKNDALGMQFRLTENLDRIAKAAMKSAYTGTPTPAMGKFGVNLTKLESETFMKIVTGAVPIDEFDKFVDQWKKGGGDEIAKEVNEAYVKTKK
ncbi:extracellular solute-binding protein [Paenibacillus sp. LjRoot153]|uniref:extracellular solute-binding protein n=1 Tax=Paenibacillus sp. LjRoot153 TaxID=3342270 RepID=UPI003ED16768